MRPNPGRKFARLSAGDLVCERNLVMRIRAQVRMSLEVTKRLCRLGYPEEGISENVLWDPFEGHRQDGTQPNIQTVKRERRPDEMDSSRVHFLGLRTDTLLSNCWRLLPVIPFVISGEGASPPSDKVTNLSISHRPAGPGGVSIL
jgi:hypothetical protein